MKKLLLLLILASGFLHSQDREFSITKEKGFTDYIVVEMNGKTASELYGKTLEWINRVYKNPEKVILGQIENEYIRFQGSSKNLYTLQALGSRNPLLTRYQIEISFKDGKYKFDVTNMEYFHQNVWYPVPTNDTLYNKKGELKSMFKHIHEIPAYFNSTNNSLSDYISGGTNDDW